ncbi:hypothetical protein OUZ56_006862 [Daphnia magna]|uniref:Uncharacterized protein n=1 Tax=Daphnia magna TaxID=35525 RepID=A0ABQ9YWX6_9CRUS|nr:hypothetical protein OUZ56_006862 [Daphnia magna]
MHPLLTPSLLNQLPSVDFNIQSSPFLCHYINLIFKNFVIGSHLDQCSSLRLRNRATCIDLNAIASLCFYPRAANCSSSFPTKNRRSNTNHPVMRRYRIYHVMSTLIDTWQRGRFVDSRKLVVGAYSATWIVTLFLWDRARCSALWGGAVAMPLPAARRLGNAPLGTSLCSMQ